MEILDYPDVVAAVATIRSKLGKVENVYSGIWSERSAIYLEIISSLRKGWGLWHKEVPDVTKDFPAQMRRLSTLHVRETTVLAGLISHKHETVQILEDIKVQLPRIEIPGMRLKLSHVIPVASVEEIINEVQRYVDALAPAQHRFLAAERRFIEAPTTESLRHAYCAMGTFHEDLKAFLKQYNASVDTKRQVLDAQGAIDRLFLSIEKGERDVKECPIPEQTKLAKHLHQAKVALRPYFNPASTNYWAAKVEDRTSAVTMQTSKLVASMFVRGGVLMPLISLTMLTLFDYQGGNMRWTFVSQYPQFYIDFNSMLLIYLAGTLDVIPGLAKYPLEGIESLFKKVASIRHPRYAVNLACA